MTERRPDDHGRQPADGRPPDKLTGSTHISPWTPGRAQWEEILNDHPRYRADQLWQGLHHHDLAPDQISNLPKALRAELAQRYAPALTLAQAQRSADSATVKWLWQTVDGTQIETVLMHYDRRSTVCISSQAGCAMGCGFCATGQAGYQRNLSVGEILEQVVAARRDVSQPTAANESGTGSSGDQASNIGRVSNVVFMGMGEPFANYDRVLTTTRRLIADFGIGARHITISTVGLVPQMRRLAEEGLQVGLALSLHAANDTLRDELVPINKRHPIPELIDACQWFRRQTGRRVSIEWAMIDGVNDRPQDAAELIDVATKARAHVNLIPLNPTPGWPTVGSPKERIHQFAREVRDAGVNVTVRANRGTDIDAACGQLAGSSDAQPAIVGPTPVSLRPGNWPAPEPPS